MQLFDVASQQRRMRILGAKLAVTGEAQVETVEIVATASAVQADYLILTNQAGVQQALYIDIDADGTLPTDPAFLAIADQVAVSIATGDDEIDNGVILAAAITLADVTVVDNLDGTVTITQDVYGDCANAVAASEDGSVAADSFPSLTVDNEGVDAAMALGSDCSVVQEEAGVYVLTFDEPFELAPQIGVLVATDNLVAKIVASTKLSCTIGLDVVTSGSPGDGLFSALILGSDISDVIRNS